MKIESSPVLMLTVGIPKEIKSQEMRVGLTPRGVRQLHERGIPVIVQQGAGSGSGFGDDLYCRSGASILPDAKALYGKADLIQKVKEPLAPEFPFLRSKQVLFCFLHLASPGNRGLLDALLRAEVTSIGYETVQMNGATPLLRPMSEIAGALAAAFAALIRAKVSTVNGRLKLPHDFNESMVQIAKAYPAPPSGHSPGRTVIFGGGVAGDKAAELALAMGGEVTLVETNPERRKALSDKYSSGRFHVSDIGSGLGEILMEADVLIGCAHAPGRRAAQVIDAETLKKISADRKKIMMDIAVDQGGNFHETRPTAYENPLYLDSFGNIRFAVSNIPSLCGPAASEALTQATGPYTAEMALHFDLALTKFPELDEAINTQKGRIRLNAIKEAHK